MILDMVYNELVEAVEETKRDQCTKEERSNFGKRKAYSNSYEEATFLKGHIDQEGRYVEATLKAVYMEAINRAVSTRSPASNGEHERHHVHFNAKAASEFIRAAKKAFKRF
ncbi:hypothetical protein HPP92_005367 [Vanilla planifolia]|uniref:Uncharacterized protein n=1 Tax=Vanilla planifolia TaxID=51239 RepID=A0A835RMS1_VANPL|nr:hypothetical protein HPP92_005367 [Vanilla planifolia]